MRTALVIGLLFLVAQDEKNVEREISVAEARAAGQAAQDDHAAWHAEYLKRAEEARKKE